jgi:hypothetical protein
VRDTATFLQNARDPARDVFTHASAAVASVVVVPLLVGDAPFGALYLTQEAACDFSNIQEALLVGGRRPRRGSPARRAQPDKKARLASLLRGSPTPSLSLEPNPRRVSCTA